MQVEMRVHRRAAGRLDQMEHRPATAGRHRQRRALHSARLDQRGRGFLPDEKFIAYARPLVEGEVKFPVEGGLPKYVALEKSRIEKKLPAPAWTS